MKFYVKRKTTESDELYHYGVKGMKWGKQLARNQEENAKTARRAQQLEGELAGVGLKSSNAQIKKKADTKPAIEVKEEIIEDKQAKSASDIDSVANDVISGKYGLGQQRYDALTKAGYDWREVQNKVNEKLGSSFRYSTDSTSTEKAVNQVKKANDFVKKTTKELKKKSVKSSSKSSSKGKTYVNKLMKNRASVGR